MTTLTRQQASKLAEEATALADWITVRDFANQVYGASKAVKVEIETYGEYNDEGGTNYYIESITACDKDGNELGPDYSLPFFQTKAWKDLDDAYSEEDEDEGEVHEHFITKFITKLKELCMSAEEQRSGSWVLIEDLPTDDVEHDLTVIPLLALPSQKEH